MGVAGKKFLRLDHSKSNSPAAQNKDGGWGQPPHPKMIRRGQQFWPRTGNKRRPFQVRTVRGDTVTGVRLDDRETVRYSVSRPLEVRPDGHGRHHQFCAYNSGRYTTYAYVHSIQATTAILVLPEWHPSRPVQQPLAVIARAAREPGAWLRCQADLGAPSAARLNLAQLRPCRPPSADECHQPAYEAPADPLVRSRPEHGPGCGDIVLEASGGIGTFLRRGGLIDVFAPKRPAGLVPGDRVYLALNGGEHVDAYLVIEKMEQAPNGAFLRCQPGAVPVAPAIPIPGERQQTLWRWRWWQRTGKATARPIAAEY